MLGTEILMLDLQSLCNLIFVIISLSWSMLGDQIVYAKQIYFNLF